jgi:hypothetical protein
MNCRSIKRNKNCLFLFLKGYAINAKTNQREILPTQYPHPTILTPPCFDTFCQSPEGD